MAQPVWLTPAGNLGTYPEGVFFQFPLLAEEPESGDTVHYQVIAGELPAGVQVAANGLIVGIPKAIATVQGVPLEVARDTTSRFAVRAYTTTTVGNVTVINRLADRTFSITVSGQDDPEFVTPAGNIATVFDGTLITDLQLEYTDSDATDITITRLAGGTLPPGTSLSLNGLITGFVEPQADPGAAAGFSRDGQGFSQYPFDFPTQSNSVTYEFVVELTDGKSSALRTFNIQVLSRNSLTADSTDITADNTYVTADGTPVRVPVLLTLPGSIGTVRSDNYFAFKFDGIQADGYPIVYVTDSETELANIGLTLDPGTGWLYGYIPNQGLQENIYNFKIRVYQSGEPDVSSVYSDYSLIVQGPIDTEITWFTPTSAADRALSPSPLGTIVNGSTSQLYVEAVNASGIPLEYRLKSGSDSNLPQGLRLLPDGNIAGRCSFNTFALDGGTTTFDVASDNRGVSAPTTFDMTFVFTVEAYSTNTQVRVNKVFSITVDRQYNEPYENLYIQAMPPQDDRDLVNSLLQNTTIIPPTLLYRGDDPNFGRATKVVYQHAFGLTAATYEDYVSSLYENHYWKNLVLGSIETAQATDDDGNVIYEVVYSRVIGGLTNDQGESVSKEVVLPYPINPNTPDEIDVVFPNSLENMRNQVIDTVGQVSTILPRWMLSAQKNGRVLGFTPAWVIAYVTPGNSEQIAYNIRTQFGTQLNLVDFEVDRYELDRALTNNWNPIGQHWDPQPPAETTFDYTAHYQLPGNVPFAGGLGYSAGDIIKIFGSQVGGVDGTNDITITVQRVGNFGIIEQAVAVGTAPLLSPGDVYNGIVGLNIVGTGSGAVWNIIVTGEDTTVFDGGSLRFIAPTIITTNTTDYDRYLVFPRRTITSVVEPFYPSSTVTWINDFGQPVQWVNQFGQPVTWIGGAPGEVVGWTNQFGQPVQWVNQFGQPVTWIGGAPGEVVGWTNQFGQPILWVNQFGQPIWWLNSNS